MTLTQAEIDRRMTEAADAAEQGDRRTAATLYNQLGKDIQTQCGRFDARALNAYEAMARLIGGGTT